MGGRAVARDDSSLWVRHAIAVPAFTALLALSLVAGVGTVAMNASERTVRDDALNRVRSNRDAAVRALSHQVADYRSTVASFADNPRVVAALSQPTPQSLEGVEAELATLATSKHAPTAFVSDLRGRNVALFPRQPALVGKDFSFRDWYQGVRLRSAPYVSSAYRSAAPGKPFVVAVSAPVRNGTLVVGYLTVPWELSSVRTVAQGAQRDDGVAITVYDQRGQRLASSLAVDVRGQPLPQPSAPGATPDQNRRDEVLSASTPMPGTGWTVSASLPADLALEPARVFRHNLLLSLGVAVVLLVLGGIIATRVGLRRAEEQEAADVERRRLSALFAASPIGIMECAPDGTIRSVNGALAGMLDYDVAALIGTDAALLIHPDEREASVAERDEVAGGQVPSLVRERLYCTRTGTALPVLVNVIATRDAAGTVLELIAFVVDQREQRAAFEALQEAERRLTQLALHDPLTGLPNRRLLLERCKHALTMARSGRTDRSSVAVLFLDLDGFKPVNDVLGHAAGDELLVAIAGDLCTAVRPTDTVARVGGDEFVVLLEQSDPPVAADVVAERVNSVVRRSVDGPAGSLPVSVSVGIAQVDARAEPDVTAAGLLARADAAMYRAKEQGRDAHAT